MSASVPIMGDMDKLREQIEQAAHEVGERYQFVPLRQVYPISHTFYGGLVKPVLVVHHYDPVRSYPRGGHRA